MRGSLDDFVNGCIDDAEEYLKQWHRSIVLLEKILSTMKEVNGEFVIPHNGGYRMCPDGLNEALKDTRDYLDSLQ